MTITLRLILVMTTCFFGFLAQAEGNSQSNQQFVDHLNYYYQDLNLSVKSTAAPATIDEELSTLEQVLGQQVTVPSGQLNNLECNNPACCSGGCCASVCDRPAATE